MPLVKNLIKLLKHFQLHKRRYFGIIGSPYGLKQSINWLVKYILVNIYYPFVVLHTFMYFFPKFNIDIRWVLISNIILVISALILIYRKYQRKKYKIENIGSLTDDGWRACNVERLDSNYKILKIAFVGDIMRIRDYELWFEPRLIEFFKDVDLVIGNFEGVITNKKSRINHQNHSESILKQLPRLKNSPQNWLLCLSNNHAADYTLGDLKKTLYILKRNNYQIFGTKSLPYFTFHYLNIVAGTMWSNRKDNGFFTRFRSIDNYYRSNYFNILYPHWHFENECYVRKKFQDRSINLISQGIYMSNIKIRVREILNSLKLYKVLEKLRLYQILEEMKKNRKSIPKWDLIFGSHTHVPQPIKVYNNKLLAYSGGNFINSLWRKKHISGLIMKCQIGRSMNIGRISVGNVEWSYTINRKNKMLKKISVVIDLERNKKNYYETQVNKLITTLLVSLIFLLFWICYYYIIIHFGILFLILYLIVCFCTPILVLYIKFY
ncbi:MAG: CapA family protein [Candidatus Hermodarchaeota archaeon]